MLHRINTLNCDCRVRDDYKLYLLVISSIRAVESVCVKGLSYEITVNERLELNALILAQRALYNMDSKDNSSKEVANSASKVGIEGRVNGIDPVAINMAVGNVDGLTLSERPKVNDDPNILGSQSEQNASRDIKAAVQDVTSNAIVIPGQSYGNPPREILLLQDYFRKPVLIGTYSWTTSTAVQSLDPYPLWEALAVINSRFSYFNKRSYNLIVSCSLAGSPYHYGMALVDWNPSNRGRPVATTNGVGFQRRHMILTPDVGYYELAIPHFSNTPYVLGSAASAATRGSLAFAPQFALARVDGVAAGTISVVVRAWVDDMVISEPSFCQTMNSKIGQAFEKYKPLVQVADTVAALWGYCVENGTGSKAMTVKNTVMLTNTDGERPCEVLTTSVNNMVPPLDVGSNLSDQLTIASLTARRGLIRKISSYTTTSAVGDVLVNIPISPLLNFTNLGVPTPLAYVSNLFNYWVGSLAFTITVYSSPLQQGAILVAHEPSLTAPTNVNNTQAVATAKCCIIDLDTSVKKTIWVSGTNGTNELLRTRVASSGLAPVVPTFYDTATAIAGVTGGYLTISVNKPLIAPAASAVYITVEVAAGPDFQLLDFNGEALSVYDMTMLSTRDPMFTLDESVCDLRIKVFEDVRERHSGEKVVSLRALLQRVGIVQEGVFTVKADNAASVPLLYTTLNVSRLIQINCHRGPTALTDAQAQKIEYNDLYNYVSNVFARRSGGQRYVVKLSYRTTTMSPQYASAHRVDGSYTPYLAANSYYASTTRGLNNTGAGSIGGQFYPGNLALLGLRKYLNNGLAQTDLRSNPYLAFEDTPVTASPFLGDVAFFELALDMRDVYASETFYTVYRAAKEDTEFYEFVGCPELSARSPTTMTRTTLSADGTIV